MPSGKTLFWMAAVALGVTFGVQHYQKIKGGQ